MSDALRVGFIGLGDQGAPIAAAIAAKSIYTSGRDV